MILVGLFEWVFLVRREDPSLVYAFVIAVQWLIVINLLYMTSLCEGTSLRVIIRTSDCLDEVISSKISHLSQLVNPIAQFVQLRIELVS